jgi:hypothetical protein
VYLYAPLSEVEPDAVQQLIKVAEAGIATGYVSAMPDVHLGMPSFRCMEANAKAMTRLWRTAERTHVELLLCRALQARGSRWVYSANCSVLHTIHHMSCATSLFLRCQVL